MGREEGEILGAAVGLDHHRRGEAAVDRQHRPLADAVESDLLCLSRRARPAARRASRRLSRAEQRELERDRHRLLDRLARRRRHSPARASAARAGRRPGGSRALTRGVPAWLYQSAERLKVDAARLLHRADEILAGRRLAVVALEIEVGAGAKLLRARGWCASSGSPRRPCCRRSRCRSWRSRDRSRAGSDARAGPASSGNCAARSTRTSSIRLTAGEPMSAENCWSRKTVKPSFRRELEPVAAGDPVARPVVEIFVRDDAVDRVVIGVGRGVGVGEDVARVEDVEALVLHRAEVEVGDRDDVEHVEIVFAAVDLLVPRHRRLERMPSRARCGAGRRAHPDAELDLAARARW